MALPRLASLPDGVAGRGPVSRRDPRSLPASSGQIPAHADVGGVTPERSEVIGQSLHSRPFESGTITTGP